MALPQRYDLTIQQGASLKRWWALRYPDGTIVDLTAEGYTIGRLQVRDAYAGEGGELLLNLTTDNGGVVIDYQADADGTFWSGYLFASATATAALVDWGEGVFDFEISNGSDVIRVMQGVATLSPESTV
jgi:hypothetical protein